MAAYAALLSLKFIINQIQQHPQPPISLDQQQLLSLTEKLDFLQNFLEAYSKELEEDELESRIADAAYAAEDVIESHIVDQIHARSKTWILIQDRRCHAKNISCLDMYEGLERVIQDMDLIKKEATVIVDRKKMIAQLQQLKISADSLMQNNDMVDFGDKINDVMDKLDRKDCDLETTRVTLDRLERLILWLMDMGAQPHQLMIGTDSSVSIGPVPVSRMQNNVMVGFGDILIDVMDKLTRIDCDLEIVPIVGMGGSGKTTLATNIYTNPLIVHHFDILVWVTISQEYNVREILLRVLSEENNGGEICDDHELGERAYKKLYGRRYLVVMDDIWNIEIWDEVKAYFPNNSDGSKIMITTRNSNLAFQSSGSHDFQMKFLDDDKSWDLLCKIIFGKECCPIELENIGKEIARNCRGLPLAIVVIGGLLTKSNKRREYWEYTLKNLNSQINLENNEHCLQILRRSYKELPMHLKPCFLYMGVFPEDHEIYVPKLIKLWVAEGFLKPTQSKSLEEVAKEYVKELIERNLILVSKLSWNGKVKECKIHDLLRDLCLREAKRQRFFCILRGEDVNNIPEDIDMERRICIHEKARGKFSQLIHAVKAASLIRSLILFVKCSIYIPPSLNCRLLRVVSCFDDSNVDGPRALFQQANLRCVFIKTPDEYRFPNPRYLLWNLQTLDVYNYRKRSTAPSKIWKMSHLRHVKFNGLQLPNPPFEEDELVLENLHTLSGILDFKCSEEVVKRIPNIKKLRLVYGSEEVVKRIPNIKKLRLFYNRDGVEKEWLHSFSLNNLCRLRNLESLYLDLKDCIFYYRFYCNPEGIQFSLPNSLKKLSLFGTGFLWEDLNTKIGSLPLLQYLFLGNDSCIGPEWKTLEGQFQSLKFLNIQMTGLKCWVIDGPHFPCLEHLHLEYLYKLEEIPSSIGDIPTLKMIELSYCSESADTSAERIKEEQLSYDNEDLQVKIRRTRN